MFPSAHPLRPASPDSSPVEGELCCRGRIRFAPATDHSAFRRGGLRPPAARNQTGRAAKGRPYASPAMQCRGRAGVVAPHTKKHHAPTLSF